MNRIFLSVICVLISFNLWAEEFYNVNWSELEVVVNNFANIPTSQAAAQIEKLLPPGKNIAIRNSSEAEVAGRIFNKIPRIQQLVESGNSEAVKVAYALTEFSDGEYSESLTEIIGAAAAINPYEYLLGIKKGRKAWNDPPCLSAVILPWDFEGDHVKVLQTRLNSIRTITDPDLKEAKECTISVLEQELKKSQ